MYLLQSTLSEAMIIFLIGQAVAIAGIGIIVYVKIMTKLKELEVRVQVVEKQDDRMEQKIDDIREKIDHLFSKLQSKQDK